MTKTKAAIGRASNTRSRQQTVQLASTATEASVASLNSFVGYNLRRAAAKQRERFRSVFEPYDIRPVQLSALTVLFDNMPISQTALGKALDIKRANVVTLLDQLENRGLVMRQRASNDRRSHLLYLTPSGKELTVKLLALHEKLEDDLSRSFGQKRLGALVELLRTFRTVDSKPKLR